jgi:hypothetical protein
MNGRSRHDDVVRIDVHDGLAERQGRGLAHLDTVTLL